MRVGKKDMMKQTTIANLYHVDFYNRVEQETSTRETHVPRETDPLTGLSTVAKKNLHK
ncbi:hypothetical protein [Caldalkalibacillus salinus]|uniref:hypothetical protein n=1 Tax=Caldalkalibacillus salinus TaxID=2803787 RepID=UPI0019204FD2|nr:hypothetical protein [Caldalkalibacillus salinus]